MSVEGKVLLDAILARRSVRRYEAEPLGADALAAVEAIVAAARPLVSGNRLVASVQHVVPGEDLAATLGAYGRIVSPPHYLLPYVVGDDQPLVEAGFRLEQIAVRLAASAIGSCFVGALHREEAVRSRFDLPAAARVPAFLIFGRPARSLLGRAVNTAIRASAGATRKLPADRIFYRDGFARSATPPAELAALVEAARSAPSAVDAQPWRLLWRDGTLHLFVKRENTKYGNGAGRDYRLHDGGACMANVSLALDARGRAAQWRLYDGERGTQAPDHPPSLQPLAFLFLPGFG